MIALRDLNENLVDDIARIESGVIIGGFARVCKELAEHVRKRDTYAEAWLEQGAAD